MSAERPASPEKQLLNLIEEPKGRSSVKAVAMKRRGLSFLSFGALKGRFTFFKDKLRRDIKEGKPAQLDIKALNGLLRFLVLILAVYLIISISLSVLNGNKKLEVETKKAGERQMSKGQATSFMRAASYYLEKTRERDIFKMGRRRLPLEEAAAKGPSQRILDATQNLKLVGISWSDDPDIMIEDTKLQRTYFLKKSQSIDKVKIEAVFKDKVVLSFEGEEIELK